MLDLMASTPHLIGTAAAAQLLGIDRSTLTRRVAAGAIEPALTIPGYRGDFLFERADIEAQAATL